MNAEQTTDLVRLRQVRERLLRAADRLDSLASQEDVGTPERSRLRGKREGVLLAESYLAEELRSPSYSPAEADHCDRGPCCLERDHEGRCRL